MAILGHCVSFLGVSYFGQMTMWLYMTLAIVGSLKTEYGKRKKLIHQLGHDRPIASVGGSA